MQSHKQEASKTDKHKPTKGIKHGQNLDFAKQTWLQSIEASKQTHA